MTAMVTRQGSEPWYLTPAQAARIVEQYQLPVLPSAVLTVRNLSNADEPNLGRICEEIAHDATLAGLVLASVNSAHYGGRERARSVIEAVHYLGLNNLNLLLARISMRQLLEQGNSAFLKGILSFSLLRATRCSRWADEYKTLDREVAYTFGLFEDIGMALLALREPKGYLTFLASDAPPCGGPELIRMEREKFGLDHATAGYVLTNSWGLPSQICESILLHEQPLDSEVVTVRALTVRKLVALSRAFNEPAGRDVDQALDTLGISKADRARILAD